MKTENEYNKTKSDVDFFLNLKLFLNKYLPECIKAKKEYYQGYREIHTIDGMNPRFDFDKKNYFNLYRKYINADDAILICANNYSKIIIIKH